MAVQSFVEHATITRQFTPQGVIGIGLLFNAVKKQPALASFVSMAMKRVITGTKRDFCMELQLNELTLTRYGKREGASYSPRITNSPGVKANLGVLMSDGMANHVHPHSFCALLRPCFALRFGTLTEQHDAEAELWDFNRWKEPQISAAYSVGIHTLINLNAQTASQLEILFFMTPTDILVLASDLEND